MVESKPTNNVLFTGRTGDGKSRITRFIAEHYNGDYTAFIPSEGVDSHTKDIVSRKLQTIFALFNIVDTPGMMDSRGVVYDENNISKIVTYARGLGNVKAHFIVIIESSERFDDAL